MSEKDNIQEELEGLSPLLSKMKAQDSQPFRVPEGYFQGLPDDVLRRARAEEGLIRENRPAQVAPHNGWSAWLAWLLLPRQAAGLAVVLLLVVAGAYLFGPPPAALSPQDALANISVDDAKEYVSEHIGEFGLELMLEAAVVSSEDMPEVEVLPDVSQEDIDNYLDELIEEMELDELEDLL